MENTKYTDGNDHRSHRTENNSAQTNNKTDHHDGHGHRRGKHAHHRHHGERNEHRHHSDDTRRGRHHAHERHHGHPHKQHQRRHRLFDYGELRLLVLVMIEVQPRHGYELIKEIETRFEGRYIPSPGVIYPTLAWLDDMGYAVQHHEGSKKQYQITDEGIAFLTANRDAANELLTRRPALHTSGESDDRTDQHNIRELMGSLRHLIKEKLFQDHGQELNNESLRENVALILQKAYDDIKKLA